MRRSHQLAGFGTADIEAIEVGLTQQNPTVQVSLSALQGGYVRDCSLVLSGALISTLPMLVVFALMGRQILGGIMQGAVKG